MAHAHVVVPTIVRRANSAYGYDKQRPAIFTNDECAIELTSDSQPSGKYESNTGARWKIISPSPFIIFELIAGCRSDGKRSPFVARFTVCAERPSSDQVLVGGSSERMNTPMASAETQSAEPQIRYLNCQRIE